MRRLRSAGAIVIIPASRECGATLETEAAQVHSCFSHALRGEGRRGDIENLLPASTSCTVSKVFARLVRTKNKCKAFASMAAALLILGSGTERNGWANKRGHSDISIATSEIRRRAFATETLAKVLSSVYRL